MEYWGEQAALWAPIVYGDEVLGVLELVEHRRRREFSEDDTTLARHMADLAAVALLNARASRAAEARNRQLTALIESSRAMTSTLDLDEVLEIVCRETAEAVGSSCSYIYEYDPEKDTMVWLAEYQRDPSRTFEEPIGSAYPLVALFQDATVIREHRPVEARLDDPLINAVDLDNFTTGESNRRSWCR